MMRFVCYAIILAVAVTVTCAAAIAQDLQLPEPVGMEGNPVAQIVLDGNAAFLHGDLHVAANDYRRAIAQQANFAIAYFNLGLVEAHEGQRARGLRDMDRGLALARAHAMSAATIAHLRALRSAFATQSMST